MKTVKEIAEITGLNKQKVYREIRKNGIKPQNKIDGINYFSDSVLRFFDKKSETQNETESEKVNSDKVCDDKSFDNFQLIQELKQEVKFLREQIKIKDNQIETLLRLLDQQQRLSLSDKKQIEFEAKKSKEKDKPVSNVVSKKTDEKADISSDVEKSSFNSGFKKMIKKIRNKL